MRLAEFGPPEDLPAADARVPAVLLRLVLALVGASLSLVVYGISGWLAVGVLFTLLAAWQPERLLAWPLIVFLAIGQLGHPAALSWRLLVLLAGLHLLHILASLTLLLPWHAWVQPAVFSRPLRRFIAIQVPAQLSAVGALLLLAPDSHGHWPVTIPAVSLIGAAALAVLALMLLRRRPSQEPAG